MATALELQQTRARRASEQTQTTEPASSAGVVSTSRLTAEPVLRIGLATQARSVTISTNGRLIKESDQSTTPEPLNIARLRIEPRRLAPLPSPTPGTESDSYANTIARAKSPNSSRKIDELTYDDGETDDGAGYTATPATSATKPTAIRPVTSGIVRPVARFSVPSRELVAYTAGTSALFSSSAPVIFRSEDERSAPVRFNEKPYRGRLEVFPNPSGALTVVNVVALEDYVRGVVPNELSPGGYPAIEALKAQAVAARTYAVKNRGQFAADGFDLLPTTRSQVYGGLSTEQPLSTRAVEETRGLVATYKGEPINALYTSTCGGRTENAENIFGEAVPYLRSRECSIESKAQFAPFTIETTREPPEIRKEENASLARDAALLSIHNFKLPARITDVWLASPATNADVSGWLTAVAQLSHQSFRVVVNEETTRPPGFSTALAAAFYGESRGDTLLNNVDVEYLLSFRDATEIPQRNRADVALLLRDGQLSLYPDATLKPREALTRGRALHIIARLLESRGTFALQKATARPTTNGALILRSGKSRDQTLIISPDAYLFRVYGDSNNNAYPARSLILVGGEAVTYHINARGTIDYLEVKPAPNGAAADRFSPFTNWTTTLPLAAVAARLVRYTRNTGALLDIRVASRGASRRVTDLELIGTNSTAHLRGGRIRSALGLREQLFVIDRQRDTATGRITAFTFTGRGWGHGVGLCQVGAYGLARSGWTYDRILKAYYTGIELTKFY
ncbi:MAG: SpoIID/LytB domain-containing protein [Pyrinomonadaceae bacterium]